ncbi:MAG: S1 domain-containing RNA-binding protein [Clostridia bacterium]|nr:S1 domain-containing RNA-binding protein [Clostridia bacterium]
MPVEVGSIVQGTVTGITDFGAFIDLPEGQRGLVHISEVSDDYVKDIRNYLKENQKIKVKVLSVSSDGKISLSIRKVKPKRSSTAPKEIDWGSNDDNPGMSFEDRLSKFLKDSDEKLQSIRKNAEAKRGGGGYRRNNYHI